MSTIYNIISNRLVLCILGLVMLSGNLFGQIDSIIKKQEISFPDYLTKMGENNLAYAAEKFNLNAADARIELAKIFPDPVLSIGYFNNGQQRLQTGYGASIEISRTIELGGKRKSRIDLANSEKELTAALIEDFFRNLRTEASLDFLHGLMQEMISEVKYHSYQYMKQLEEAQLKRYSIGSIMEIDAIQSKVESDILLNDFFQSQADYQNSLIKLSFWLGKHYNDTLFSPVGNLKTGFREFELQALITNAQNNRADILAALKNKETARKTLALTKANRTMDIDIALSNLYVSRISNIIEPTPSYNSMGAGIIVPLKFSNKYKGDLKLAETQVKQTELLYRNIELQIAIEVTQAYNKYIAAQRQVKQFDLGLFQNSKKVLDGKIYSYKRGETSLLDVLNAQRTYNDVQLNYYQTLFNHAAALVELESAAGIWDLNF